MCNAHGDGSVRVCTSVRAPSDAGGGAGTPSAPEQRSPLRPPSFLVCRALLQYSRYFRTVVESQFVM